MSRLCDRASVDFNECETNICSGTCINEPSGFSCRSRKCALLVYETMKRKFRLATLFTPVFTYFVRGKLFDMLSKSLEFRALSFVWLPTELFAVP